MFGAVPTTSTFRVLSRLSKLARARGEDATINTRITLPQHSLMRCGYPVERSRAGPVSNLRAEIGNGGGADRCLPKLLTDRRAMRRFYLRCPVRYRPARETQRKPDCGVLLRGPPSQRHRPRWIGGFLRDEQSHRARCRMGL